MSTPQAAADRAGALRFARRGPAFGDAAKRAFWDFAHLAVVSTFALAQPLFDLLGDNPEFFAARGSPGFDIVSFGVFVVLVPPLLMLVLELLVGLVHRHLRRGLHLAFVALGVALIVAQPLKESIDASDAVLIALAVGIGGLAALAYHRAEPVRSFFSVLSPAPIVLLALFLFVSPVSKLAFADEAKARSIGGVTNAPVVVVLFDELPTESLMDERRQVDGERYPAFAQLARDGTWFRNAYTIYDSTERAQPAIMDGNHPDEDKLPTSSDHPNSIFSLLGKTHRMNVSEEATAVCSRDLCEDERLDESYGSRISSMAEDLGLVWLHVVSPPDIERDLASVSENWGNFGAGDTGAAAAPGDRPNTRANLNRARPARFESWIADIKPTHRPALNFKHALLPHIPWQYLPDGRLYRSQANDPLPGLSSYSYNDQGQLDVLYQRHLLQLGFADYELGKLLRHLKRIGQYDKSLIVVAADHGVAFDLGKRDRRKITRRNFAQIAPVPLFVKAPGQEKGGKIDDAYVETVDILPTIFDLLNVDPKVRMDGKSAFGPEVQRRRSVRVFERGSFDPIRFSVAAFESEKRQVLEKKLRLFGTGRDGPDRIYRIGPHQELLGAPVSSLDVAPSGDAKASFAAADDLRDVDLGSGKVPIWIAGTVEGGDSPRKRDVAIAVNGRIAAVGNTLEIVGQEGEHFSVLVPEDTLRQGRNSVEVLEVRPEGGTLTLVRLGEA